MCLHLRPLHPLREAEEQVETGSSGARDHGARTRAEEDERAKHQTHCPPSTPHLAYTPACPSIDCTVIAPLMGTAAVGAGRAVRSMPRPARWATRRARRGGGPRGGAPVPIGLTRPGDSILNSVCDRAAKFPKFSLRLYKVVAGFRRHPWRVYSNQSRYTLWYPALFDRFRSV